ncbi:hypothetical protein BDV95DRAFT_490890 [Massariosphaeria phaeospora]|uniref:Uncharacterized protein n=1 Tax=Massariosphaeria phaeospora TaxID=100035 RepID=A0A7C8I8E7_9PLEO|nr:hypothetical protein BDV95DRAFT_490890 [Massariosphaeria phaeospora]
MENRHSSPSPKEIRSRPQAFRHRSNSLPIGDVLGCSTPEAELLLAEGRAAVRTRRGRRHRSPRKMEEASTFRPREHLRFLDRESTDDVHQQSISPWNSRGFVHSRIPSDSTDCSSSTIVPTAHSPVEEAIVTPGSPLGSYSNQLAQFMQSQLNSIPSYNPSDISLSPRSCPDLTFHSKSPPPSPNRLTNRGLEVPWTIEIPPLRPPLRSAFSAWSTTDEDTDDDLPQMPDMTAVSKGSNYVPSLLGYYEQTGGSFLFPSTPPEEGEPHTAKALSFPNRSTLPGSTEPCSPSQRVDDCSSSARSVHSDLASSSAPSFSSTSTSSYFDHKRPMALPPNIHERIVAAVSPHRGINKIITAVSPFEGGRYASVHNILVESQQRVHVDGMSFDMIGDLHMSSGARIPTPC